jgi:hypothetical protein
LGEALLAVFAHALCAQDLSPVTARGYLHDLDKWWEWLESSGGKPRDLRRVGRARPWLGLSQRRGR